MPWTILINTLLNKKNIFVLNANQTKSALVFNFVNNSKFEMFFFLKYFPVQKSSWWKDNKEKMVI